MSTESEHDNDQPTRTKVFEDFDVEETQGFHVTPEDTGIEVGGPGSLDTLLVVCENTDNFGVRVETESTTLIDDKFSTLGTLSDHLEHVSAETDGNDNRILSVTDFPFREMVRAKVLVFDEQCTFSRVRAVYTLGREVDY